MYYANILRSLSSRLEVITEKIALPRVKNFTRKVNFANFNFAVQSQPRKPQKFVDHENFPSYGMYYDILLGTNFVSTIRNTEVSTFGRVLKYYINSPSIGTAWSVCYLEVSPIGRCLLREVPL